MLEKLAAVDTVVLDKTGTLTQGKLLLEGVAAEPGCSEEQVGCLGCCLCAMPVQVRYCLCCIQRTFRHPGPAMAGRGKRSAPEQQRQSSIKPRSCCHRLSGLQLPPHPLCIPLHPLAYN